jgi:lysophospholipase L1-like esterase
MHATPRYRIALLALICLFSFSLWQSGDAAAAPATSPAAVDDGEQGLPTEAVPKRGSKAEQFLKLHQQFLNRIQQGPIDLLFIGDSITAGWASRAQDIWDKYYGPHNAANFGIGGDRTQHVLWRITNGELDGIRPRVIVLMIGTNNTGRDSPDRIAAGVEKIVATIRTKLPETKILLLGTFPRMKGYAKQGVKIAPINSLIGKLDLSRASRSNDDGKMVRYLDISEKFKDADGEIPVDIMPDGLHPSSKGYQIWADAMQPLLSEMMK